MGSEKVTQKKHKHRARLERKMNEKLTDWRRCSLEFHGSKTAESISEVPRAKILGHRLASTHLWRKQQDEVPELHEIQNFVTLCSCHSRTPLVGIWKRLSWWVTSIFHTNGKNSCFIEDVHSMSFQSSNHDSRLESEGGRQTIFTPLNLFGDNPDEEEPSDDLSNPGKAHDYSKCKNTQDAVCWVNLARAQDKGLRFWQTKSNAAIVYNSVRADCIHSVISQKGECTLFERLSMHRPTPKIVLESAWQSQQPQQDTSERASSRTGTGKPNR